MFTLIILSLSKPVAHESGKTDTEDRKDEKDVDVSVLLIVVIRRTFFPLRVIERALGLILQILKYCHC